MGIGDGSAEANVAANRAVVWALASRVACGGPAVWLDAKAGLLLQKRIFLFNAVPGFFILTVLENRRGEGSEVGVCRNQRLEIVVLPAESLTKHEDVVALSEGIREEGARFEDDFRVFSCGLVRRRSVVIPIRQLIQGGDLLGKGAALGAESHGSINPDVFGDDGAILVEVS